MEKLHHLEFKFQEMQLLRGLVSEIEAVEQAYPGVVPHGIMKKYIEIKKFYAVQLANEEYEATTNFHDLSELNGFD